MASEGSTIALPSGGGALSGIGETFQPDLHTGTAHLSVPIPLPAGRAGLTPTLALAYDSASGNGPFGLGWSLAVPNIARRTDRRIPTYDDQTDVFVLSGAEELAPVPLGAAAPSVLPEGVAASRYRPRTEAGFARIVHITGTGRDYWDVFSRDGLHSRYGTAPPANAPADWTDPAVIRRPDGGVYSWLLTRTEDSLGNHIAYGYRDDGGSQRYLETVAYADYGDPSNPEYAITVSVSYDDKPRPDPFSNRRPGFELRTTLRATQIAVATPGSNPATTVTLTYQDQTAAGPVSSAVSLLAAITIAGHDPAVTDPEPLPPLTFTYRDFDPQARRYQPLASGVPPQPLAGSLDLVDLFGDGLPSVIELDGSARYWRNRGQREFEPPRMLTGAPAGGTLGAPGVLLEDLDGDGRAELLVSNSGHSSVWALASGDQAGFDPTPRSIAGVPSVGYGDPQLRTLDLDGDHNLDLLLGGAWPAVASGDGTGGFTELRPVASPPPPLSNLADPRVRVADMTGDGLIDLVLIYDGAVTYWPNLGYGRFGAPIRMADAPRFADSGADPGLGYDPRRLVLADFTGDGTADAVYVADGTITIWINQSGNGFAAPITIRGTPQVDARTAVRAADVNGIGVSGLLWSGIGVAAKWAFLDPTGGVKLYLMTAVDNHRGATTTLTWSTSTSFAAADRTAGRPWRTTLPFPVHVIAATQTHDVFSDAVLTSAFRYHDGYWDPVDREFRGFGCVEQSDSLAPLTADPPLPASQRALDPLTPAGSVPNEFDAAKHGNLLSNWSFDAPGGPPTTLTTTAAQPFAPGAAAAPGWSIWNNVVATTTTELLPSSLPQGAGGQMLHISTTAAGCGLVHTFGDAAHAPPRTVSSVWVHINRGSVVLGTGNGGDTGADLVCDETGRWILLQAGNGRSPASELIVYAASEGGADFYIDHAWVRAADVPATPLNGPALRTVTWFHLGPVVTPTGGWRELDPTPDYWSEDPPLLPTLDLTALPGAYENPAIREALRGLRGRIIRHELYADDGDPTYGKRPYEVHDNVLQVAPVLDGRAADDPGWVANPVVTAREILTRDASWDRGDEPMIRLTATSGFDDYGRPRTQVALGVPRGRKPGAGGEPCLATVTTTDYATRDDSVLYRLDRVSATARHEAVDSGTGPVIDFIAQALGGQASGELRALEFSYYDGDPFTGLELGQLGDHGLPVRTEHLVITPDRLIQLTQPAVPGATTSTNSPYLTLDGSPPVTAPWDGYPAAFQASLMDDAPAARGSQLGYVWHGAADPYVPGYYAQTSRLCYDVQAPVAGQAPRGLPLIARGAYGGDTTTAWDQYDLLPSLVTDPVGLQTSATYDYRVLKPEQVTDANRNVTQVGYTPLGLTAWIARLGKDGQQQGDTVQQPGQTFTYDLTAFDDSTAVRQPLSVTTTRRIDHRWTLVDQENAARAAAGQPPLTDAEIAEMFGPDEPDDHFIHTVEFSDGFGRLLQTRTQADDLALPDVGLPDDLTAATSVVTAVGAAADSPRVVVGGWKAYDNKGRPIVTYEPFFDAGYTYQPSEAIPLDTLAAVQQHYDPRGRPTATVAADGSQTRVVYGIPANPAYPSAVTPTPWETYTYDANDNAGRTHPTVSLDILGHWDTPSSTVLDALGRTVQSIRRGLAHDLITTHAYDIDGNLIGVTDPLGRATAATVYDHDGKPWLTWLLDAGSVRTIHDPADGIAERRDDKGAVALAAFDPAHRAKHTWAADRAGQPLTLREVSIYGDEVESGLTADQALAANARGRITVAYDEAGRITTTGYDLDGNPLATTRQILKSENLVSLIPSTGQWTTTAYAVDWPLSAEQTVSALAEGLLDPTLSRTDATFDGLGRRTGLIAPLDATGQRAQIAFHYGRGGGINAADVDGGPHLQSVIYDPHGRRSAAFLGNGVLLRYLYDPETFRLRRLFARHATLAGTTWTCDGDVLQDVSYRYDRNGNVLTIGDRTPECGLPSGTDPLLSPDPDALNRPFTYDPLDRLLTARGRETDLVPSPPYEDNPRSVDVTKARPYTETYTYDDVDNLSALEHDTPLAAGAYTRTFTIAPGSNRLQALTIGATSSPYSYDSCGNLLTEATNRFFEWDHADRLATFRDQAGPQTATKYAQYRYDATGERVVKLTCKGSAKIDEVTIYLGGFERTLVAAADGSFTAYDELHLTDHGSRLVTILRGAAHPDDPMPNQPVRYELGDHLSSVVATLDAGGGVLNREEYLPYGETAFGSYARKRYRYTGKERDGESGLSYHVARYYAPWLGRWISCDPNGLHDNGNLYSYVGGRPTVSNDPSGRWANILIGAAVGALVGGGIELGRELYRGQNVDWKHVGASAAGGGVAGAVAGATLGLGLLAEALGTGGGAALGGATTRALTGDRQSPRAAATDFAIGVATFGVLKGATAGVGAMRSALTSADTAASAEAAERLGTVLEKGGPTGGRKAASAIEVDSPQYRGRPTPLRARSGKGTPDPSLQAVPHSPPPPEGAMTTYKVSGEGMHQGSRALEAEIKNLAEARAGLPQGATGTVRVATSDEMCPSCITNMFDFVADYPGIKLEVFAPSSPAPTIPLSSPTPFAGAAAAGVGAASGQVPSAPATSHVTSERR